MPFNNNNDAIKHIQELYLKNCRPKFLWIFCMSEYFKSFGPLYVRLEKLWACWSLKIGVTFSLIINHYFVIKL